MDFGLNYLMYVIHQSRCFIVSEFYNVFSFRAEESKRKNKRIPKVTELHLMELVKMIGFLEHRF